MKLPLTAWPGRTPVSDVDFWRTWLACACVNPLSIENYAMQLVQHRVDAERCSELTERDLIGLGMSLLDAELCVRYAREQAMWDQFSRQPPFAADTANVIDVRLGSTSFGFFFLSSLSSHRCCGSRFGPVQMIPLQAECTPAPTQPTKKRSHVASSTADDFKPPLPLADLAAAMRSNASSVGISSSSSSNSSTQSTSFHAASQPLPVPQQQTTGAFNGMAGFQPLVPQLHPMFGSSPPQQQQLLPQPQQQQQLFGSPPVAADQEHVPVIVMVDEPSDPIMSARSAHVYTLRIRGPHIEKVTVFTETEACDKTSDGVLVESSTAQPASNDASSVLLHVRLRFKAHRLQVRRAVFECVVKMNAADPVGTTIVVRSSPFIVCSHITSQRQQALERLDAARTRATVGALQDRILQLYRECTFARQLTQRDLLFLRETAAQQAGAEGAGAAVTDATLVNVVAFWEWLRKAIKLLVRLRPYWETGVIAGFIGRNDAVDLLANQPDGTCVVRFSSSVPKAFAVTCKIGGAISNKMIDKTAAGDWKLFTSSLRSFSGNLANVVDIHGRTVPLEYAFPPIPSVAEPPTPKQNDDLGYDETRSVNELVNAMRSANLN
jgi:hypothetical protein